MKGDTMTTDPQAALSRAAEGPDDDVGGRATRLKAAFPGAYHQDGALVTFDLDAIREQLGWRERVETRAGLRFERLRDEVWVSLETKVGNVISAWSWRVTADEWDRVVAGLAALEPRP